MTREGRERGSIWKEAQRPGCGTPAVSAQVTQAMLGPALKPGGQRWSENRWSGTPFAPDGEVHSTGSYFLQLLLALVHPAVWVKL